MRVLFSLLIGFMVLVGHGQELKYVTVQRSVNLMGDKFDITVVADNEEIGYINIEEAVSEIKRIEKLISSWDEESETSKINKNAGIKPVKVRSYGLPSIERDENKSRSNSKGLCCRYGERTIGGEAGSRRSYQCFR